VPKYDEFPAESTHSGDFFSISVVESLESQSVITIQVTASAGAQLDRNVITGSDGDRAGATTSESERLRCRPRHVKLRF
jgi:hypothetical protein